MRKKGSVYIMIILSSAVIYIIAMAFVFQMTTLKKQGILDKHRLIAKYLSEAGIERSLNEVSNIFYQPLFKTEPKEINYDKLSLLDPELASEFTKVLEIKNFITGGDIFTSIEILNITANPQLASGLKIVPGEEDTVPERLNIYKVSDSGTSSRKLGGYVATLRITSKGVFNNREYTTTVSKSIKVVNMSPLAEEYTLFIRGKNEEFLKYGKFVLSNWTVDMSEISNLVTQIEEMGQKAHAQIPSTSINDFTSMLNFVKNFVIANRDSEIRREASNLLFNLDFRRWGRIRTNGTLQVFLPFFEVDDIINYFVENQYYSKPEVGYIGCYNRLHNTYLGKYTRFEGNIRKHYYRLAPYILSRHFPVERNDKYTRFSTDSYYPQEKPDEFDPENFVLTKVNDIERFIHQESSRDLKLHGTRTNPIRINGLYNVKGNLNISGFVKGKGAFIVEGNLVLEGNITYTDKSSLMLLLSLNSPILIPPMIENLTIDASIYSKESIRGGKQLKINGNLVVENLNRQQGAEARDTIMPRDVEIDYSKELRNYYARHIYGGVSLKPVNKYLNELTDNTLQRLKLKERNMHK